MKSRLTQVLLAAALVAPLFIGAAMAQPSAGPGPNAASSEPNPANSLPRGATTGQTNPMPNDGRIVLQPQQGMDPAPMATTQRRMTRRQMARARHRARRAPMHSRSTATSRALPGNSSGPVAGAPSAGAGSLSNASPR